MAILGAGPVGAALAHALAERDCLAAIRLLDPAPGVAAGKALDLRQAGAIEGVRTLVEGSADEDALAGADLLVLADPAGPGGPFDDCLRRLRSAVDLLPHAPIILSGPDAADVIERASLDTPGLRFRLLGTAPLAAAAALAAAIAREAGVSPADVTISLLGRPPGRSVVGWQAATIAGDPLTAVFQPSDLARLAARLPQLWPPAPVALAAAAARVIARMAGGISRRWCCSVAVPGEHGHRALAWPVEVGSAGIERMLEPVLSPRERLRLENLQHAPPEGASAFPAM